MLILMNKIIIISPFSGIDYHLKLTYFINKVKQIVDNLLEKR